MNKIRILSAILTSFFLIISNNLEGQDTARHILLGEVSITGNFPTEPEILLRTKISESDYKNDLSQVMADIPGIWHIEGGSRNESSLFIRGFDSRQFSVFVDGVPVYISYDGTMDMARLLSRDYYKIAVSRGFTSLLYGFNTMGGAINLITPIPQDDFEMDVSAGTHFGNDGYEGYHTSYRMGGRSGKFIFQTNYSRRDLNFWALSEKFDFVSLQEKGRRDNSDQEDISLGLRLGYVSDNNNQIIISYSKQTGEKGIPVYDGSIQNPRYWRMPDWDKESLSLLSDLKTGKNSGLKLRIYYDGFFNLLESYDNSNFQSQLANYAFSSRYDDHSLGMSSEFSWQFKKHNAGIAFGYKTDNHSEQSDVDLVYVNIEDHNFWMAVEDVYNLSEKINLVSGISINQRSNYLAEELNNENEVADLPNARVGVFNYRMGMFYKFRNDQKIWAGISQNSRFATMKERYSYRLGRSLPNPELKPEKASHLILGYDLRKDGSAMNIEFFYIAGKDRISYVTPEPDIIQYQNIERTASFGTDIQFNKTINRYLKVKLAYSFLRLKNLDDEDFYFVDIPEHKFNFVSSVQLSKSLMVKMDHQYISKRQSYSDGSYTSKPFGLLGFHLREEFKNQLYLSAGINNFLDKNYFYSDGYPARGRNYYLSMGFSL